MKNAFVMMSALLLSILIVGCGKKSDMVPANTSETVTEAASGNEKTDTVNHVEVVDSGIISHLLDVANDPNATSISNEGVTYMFSKDSNGNRTLGTVAAFYNEFPDLDNSSKEDFCHSYVENVITELIPFYENRQINDENGQFGMYIPTDRCLVILMPSEDYKSIMVVVSDKNAGTSADNTEQKSESITLTEVYNWYVGEVWNPITRFRDYIESDTDNTGVTFDAEFAYEQYLKSIIKKDEYTSYIHDNHPEIISAWDKMMEQVDIINANLEDGFDVGSEEINTDLLSQYSEAFYKYANQ